MSNHRHADSVCYGCGKKFNPGRQQRAEVLCARSRAESAAVEYEDGRGLLRPLGDTRAQRRRETR